MVWSTFDFMDMFMILVLIVMLLQLMIYYTGSSQVSNKKNKNIKQCLDLLKKCNCNELKCASLTNQECKVRPNSNKPSFFYPYTILVNKSSGSCNNINDPYVKLCVPDLAKNHSI